jgi:Uncharacterised protein family UPF0547
VGTALFVLYLLVAAGVAAWVWSDLHAEDVKSVFGTFNPVDRAYRAAGFALFWPLGVPLYLYRRWEGRRTMMELYGTTTPLSGGASKTCPDCAEQVKPAANVCRHCGHRFDSGEESSAPAG